MYSFAALSGLIVMYWRVVNITQRLLYGLIVAVSHLYKTWI